MAVKVIGRAWLKATVATSQFLPFPPIFLNSFDNLVHKVAVYLYSIYIFLLDCAAHPGAVTVTVIETLFYELAR